MKIELGIMGLLSIAVGIVAMLYGGEPELLCVNAEFSLDGDEFSAALTPVVAFWIPPSGLDVLCGDSAYALGSCVVANGKLRDHPYVHLLLWHEMNHVMQQMAFGPYTPLLYPFANFEGEPYYSMSSGPKDFSIFEKCIDTMTVLPGSRFNFIILRNTEPCKYTR